jgi:hypothetical protein
MKVLIVPVSLWYINSAINRAFSNNLSSNKTDHVDGVRVRLWTAASNGSIIHFPVDIWAWRTMVKWYWQGKTLDLSTTALPGNPTAEPYSSKSGGTSQKEMNLAFEVHLFTLRSYFLHAAKFYNMKPIALLPLRRKVCCGFLSPLKIHHLGRVWTGEPWIQWQAR